MSVSSALEFEATEMNAWQATGTDGAANLQQVAAERLAAHRNRRASAAAQEAEQEIRSRQRREAARQAMREDQRRGATAVRDLVKARYERRESYREFLASEAERAISQAQAEADVAARSARAVTEAQMQLLEEIDSFNLAEPGPREQAFARVAAEVRGELAHALADIALGAKELIAEPLSRAISEPAPQPVSYESDSSPEPAIREISASGLTVRLFEDMPGPAPTPRLEELSVRHGAESMSHAVRFVAAEADDDLYALEEEIAFRREAGFAPAVVIQTQAIPGNLIEFPRELVAPKRARPRLAEGPLRDELGQPQLRIFEVDAIQEMPAPEFVDPQAVPDWQGMLLESATVEEVMPSSEFEHHFEPTIVPQTAPVERRLMAAAVDAGWVGAAWMGAVALVAEVCGPELRALTLPLLGGIAVGSLALFAVLYQLLFFSLSESTPGMRWARIGLCTFGDRNPTRREMRRRVFSTILAACPLGLGLAWIWMDNDRMGWHDRMSRMYQRAY